MLGLVGSPSTVSSSRRTGTPAAVAAAVPRAASPTPRPTRAARSTARRRRVLPRRPPSPCRTSSLPVVHCDRDRDVDVSVRLRQDRAVRQAQVELHAHGWLQRGRSSWPDSARARKGHARYQIRSTDVRRSAPPPRVGPPTRPPVSRTRSRPCRPMHGDFHLVGRRRGQRRVGRQDAWQLVGLGNMVQTDTVGDRAADPRQRRRQRRGRRTSDNCPVRRQRRPGELGRRPLGNACDSTPGTAPVAPTPPPARRRPRHRHPP